MILREVATSHSRQLGGWFWTIIEPIAAVALLAFALSQAFQSPPLGHSFALFYATGVVPYVMFHDIAQKVATATRFSKPLLGFGPVTFLDALLARFCLNTLAHLVIAAVVFLALLSTIGGAHALSFGGVLLALAQAATLAVGLGLLNCFLFLAIPTWERLWAVAMRPLFLISGVVFLLEDAPGQTGDWLWYNPLFHVTGTMRTAFYPNYDASYVNLAYSFGVPVALGTIGLTLLLHYHNDLIQR